MVCEEAPQHYAWGVAAAQAVTDVPGNCYTTEPSSWTSTTQDASGKLPPNIQANTSLYLSLLTVGALCLLH